VADILNRNNSIRAVPAVKRVQSINEYSLLTLTVQVKKYSINSRVSKKCPENTKAA